MAGSARDGASAPKSERNVAPIARRVAPATKAEGRRALGHHLRRRQRLAQPQLVASIVVPALASEPAHEDVASPRRLLQPAVTPVALLRAAPEPLRRRGAAPGSASPRAPAAARRHQDRGRQHRQRGPDSTARRPGRGPLRRACAHASMAAARMRGLC